MSLEDRRITDYRVSIADLPDKVEGRAQWLKEQFDARTDEEVKSSINGIVDDLGAATGASEVGAVLPAGLTPVPAPGPGETVKVQHVLGGLKKYADDKVTEIGAADMQKAVYDPDGEVAAAGGIPAALLSKATLYQAEAAITGGVLAVTSLFPHPQTEYDVRFVMPAGTFTSVSIDGAAMTGVFDTTGDEADFEPAAGVPVTLTRQGDRAFVSGGEPLARGIIDGWTSGKFTAPSGFSAHDVTYSYNPSLRLLVIKTNNMTRSSASGGGFTAFNLNEVPGLPMPTSEKRPYNDIVGVMTTNSAAIARGIISTSGVCTIDYLYSSSNASAFRWDGQYVIDSNW